MNKIRIGGHCKSAPDVLSIMDTVLLSVRYGKGNYLIIATSVNGTSRRMSGFAVSSSDEPQIILLHSSDYFHFSRRILFEHFSMNTLFTVVFRTACTSTFVYLESITRRHLSLPFLPVREQQFIPSQPSLD